MTRNQVDALMTLFDQAEETFERVSEQADASGSYYARVKTAQGAKNEAWRKVETAQEKLGEARCAICKNWYGLEALADHEWECGDIRPAQEAA